ncbi:MAG: hypothetical protein ACREO9_06495 [Lysobacterales bacterium]
MDYGRIDGAVAAAWSPAGSRMALANQKRIWVYDVATLQEVQVLFSRGKGRSKYTFEFRYGLDNTLARYR